MKLIKTKINDIFIIESIPFKDERGYFMEVFHQQKFNELGINVVYIQDNFATSQKGTIRGLHYQFKYPQGKLVRCVKGEILDVAVDIRKNSPTFGQHVAEVLSEKNFRQLYIPPGFAHGYAVLSDLAEVSYKCTDFYHPEDEYGIRWNDSELKINWNIENPKLSNKDKTQPFLNEVKELF